MTADEIRRLPHDIGLLAYRNRRGVLLDLNAWDQRKDARSIQMAKSGTETEQQAVFAEQRKPVPIDQVEDEQL